MTLTTEILSILRSCPPGPDADGDVGYDYRAPTAADIIAALGCSQASVYMSLATLRRSRSIRASKGRPTRWVASGQPIPPGELPLTLLGYLRAQSAPMTAPALAGILGRKRDVVAVQLRELEARGYVQRGPPVPSHLARGRRSLLTWQAC
jgi:hypothetical protein